MHPHVHTHITVPFYIYVYICGYTLGDAKRWVPVGPAGSPGWVEAPACRRSPTKPDEISALDGWNRRHAGGEGKFQKAWGWGHRWIGKETLVHTIGLYRDGYIMGFIAVYIWYAHLYMNIRTCIYIPGLYGYYMVVTATDGWCHKPYW